MEGQGLQGDTSSDEVDELLQQATQEYKQGTLLARDGEVSQAALAYHNAMMGFEQSGNSHGVANALDKLGDLCKVKSEFAKALTYYAKAAEVCEGLDDILSRICLQRKKADCYRGLKDHAAALDLYHDLLGVYERMNNPGSALDILEEMADIYDELGEYENCSDAYKTAASLHANFRHSKLAREFLDKAAAVEKKGRGK